MSIVLNIAVVIFEIIGLKISISARKWQVCAYYTQISNIITLISSCVLLAAALMTGAGAVVYALRYLSSVMLLMTFLITLFVLVPMGAGFKTMMLSGNGLYHHTICPIISITSYIVWEQHSELWILPVASTLIYGIVMLIMNGKGRFDGPYPFLRVHHQSKAATVLWMLALIILISILAIGITKLA